LVKEACGFGGKVDGDGSARPEVKERERERRRRERMERPKSFMLVITWSGSQKPARR
jgi:hypothetical protein